MKKNKYRCRVSFITSDDKHLIYSCEDYKEPDTCIYADSVDDCYWWLLHSIRSLYGYDVIIKTIVIICV